MDGVACGMRQENEARASARRWHRLGTGSAPARHQLGAHMVHMVRWKDRGRFGAGDRAARGRAGQGHTREEMRY